MTEQERLDQLAEEIFQLHCDNEISVDSYLDNCFLLTDYQVGSITLKQLNERITI